MPRKNSKPLDKRPLQRIQQNDVTNKNTLHSKQPPHDEPLEKIVGLKSIFDNQTSEPSPSTSSANEFSADTAVLKDELDSFRLRWRRELEGGKSTDDKSDKENKSQKHAKPAHEINDKAAVRLKSEEQNYKEAKRLFLIGVGLEQDDMHHESILYYRKAMHLYPDIEKQIFKEQCAISLKETPVSKTDNKKITGGDDESFLGENVDLYKYICQRDYDENQGRLCKPQRNRPDVMHLSDLPRELILKIINFVVGEELDLASLEAVGLVCRGLFLISRDPAIWRSICYHTWGRQTLSLSKSFVEDVDEEKDGKYNSINWRRMFSERPRVNFDGVYISRTKYIRQGDVGFQDITYRPFHMIRYYRYLRFFPDNRVLILTTNEEPDRIIPIFRHAMQSKQFSPELSILEGNYEFTDLNIISIVAEKDCRNPLAQTLNQKRQSQFHWSRQTPLKQTFNLKFKLSTVENKPYRNNVLRWVDYSISSELETGPETTCFDICPETFPNLIFARVKRFNLKLVNPLPSH